jgi:membrane-associated phospholipid phosphatase
VFGEFASRTTRAYLVGTPTLLLTQSIIGAGRPIFDDPTSRWQPFKYDKGVSGHAFVGAMPFITLAQMSDNFWLKTGFYTCSTFTAWSRFNDGAHYFSQCLGGWYLAYLSCRAVSKTEYQLIPRGLTVFPIMEPRTTGIGLVYQW